MGEMSELREWISMLGLVRRRIGLILAVPAVAVAAAVLVSTMWVQPLYEAGTVLWVVRTDGVALDSMHLLFHRNLATTYAEVAKTGHMAERVAAKRTTSTSSAHSLQKLLRVRQLQAPEMMVISIRHHDPSEAAAIANAYAQALIEEMRRFTNLGNLQVLEVAKPPSSPITPGTTAAASVALFVGLIAGVALAMLMELQSPKRHSTTANQ